MIYSCVYVHHDNSAFKDGSAANDALSKTLFRREESGDMVVGGLAEEKKVCEHDDVLDHVDLLYWQSYEQPTEFRNWETRYFKDA